MHRTTQYLRHMNDEEEKLRSAIMAAVYTHGWTEHGVALMDCTDVATAKTCYQLHPRLLVALPRSARYRPSSVVLHIAITGLLVRRNH